MPTIAIRTLLLAVGAAGALLAASAPQAAAGNGAMAVDCNGATALVGASCHYDSGAIFNVEVNVTERPGAYVLLQTMLSWTDVNLDYKPRALSTEFKWPQCEVPVRGATDKVPVNHGCLTGVFPPLPSSTYEGTVLDLEFACRADGDSPIDLVPASGGNTNGALFTLSAGNTQVVPKLTNASVRCGGADPPGEQDTGTDPDNGGAQSCAGLEGSKLTLCKARARCSTLKGKKKKKCQALAACAALKGKKKSRCRARARCKTYKGARRQRCLARARRAGSAKPASVAAGKAAHGAAIER